MPMCSRNVGDDSQQVPQNMKLCKLESKPVHNKHPHQEMNVHNTHEERSFLQTMNALTSFSKQTVLRYSKSLELCQTLNTITIFTLKISTYLELQSNLYIADQVCYVNRKKE